MSVERDSDLHVGGAPRSRKAFRWMPTPVLWHNLPTRGEAASTLGRNLYARKLRENSDPPRAELEVHDLLRWQSPLAYLIIARRHGWLLTWHAPWCRRCDCPGAGWHFSFGDGYWSGFGFELSLPAREQR